MPEQTPAIPTERPPRFSLNMRWRLAAEAIWFMLALLLALVLFALSAVAGPGPNPRLMSNLVQRLLPILLMLPPTILIMTSGGLDLSIGSVAGLTMFIVAQASERGAPLLVGAGTALVVALAIGLLNGMLVGGARINGVIVTLGTGALVQGIALAGQSNSIVVPDALETFGEGVGVVLLWLIALLAVLVTALLLYLTPFGRRPQPGDDRQEGGLARLFFVGSPYVFSSLLAALAGLATLGILGAAFPNAMTTVHIGLLMAALVSGTPYGLGYGNVIAGIPAALAGVLLDQFIALAQFQADSSPFYLRGAAILLAALLAHLFAFGAQALYRSRATAPEPASGPSPD